MSDTNPPTESTATTWQDWATRTTAILAVLAALSSGRWGASNLQAILEQGKVNDTWAFYQAKSLKQHGAEQTRELAKALATGQSGENAAALIALQKKMDAEAKREAKDKDERQVDARKFETSRDHMVERGFWFEISFACLQLGVILSTIAVAAKRKMPWAVSISIGILGLVVLANGIYPFFHAPHSWYEGVSENMSYDVKSPPPGVGH